MKLTGKAALVTGSSQDIGQAIAIRLAAAGARVVINVNLKGVFFAAQAMAQHLIETRRPGKTINISSNHKDLPFPNFAAHLTILNPYPPC